MPEQITRIPLSNLVPWQNGGKGQPRKHFDQQALQELADAIRTGGFIGAIAVRPNPGQPGTFEILAGHRRTKAAALAGLDAIPATVHNLDDSAARFYVLQDNLQRQDFLLWEEGAGYAELVGDGLSVAAVAGRVGKSPSYVAGRIAIHEGAGEKVRELYLAGELTVEAVQLCSALPNRDLSPVRCPSCKCVCGEQWEACTSCGADLSAITRYPSGNPQTAAALLCRGKVNGVAKEFVEKVRQSYGISEVPVQTSLGFSDRQISEAAVKVRSALERKLAEVAEAGGYFLQHSAKIQELPGDQRQAIADQCGAAIKWLLTIQQEAQPAQAQLTLAG